CRSPLTACKTIGHAISLAASGDAVTIAAATYIENVTIPHSLTVTGSGAGDTIIDGGGFPLFRGPVVTILNASTNVTLSNVTLQNGNAKRGAGVYNQGTLTINTSVITGNLAHVPGCFPFPDHCIVQQFYGFGGGIYNTGTLTINRTTIAANEAFGLKAA